MKIQAIFKDNLLEPSKKLNLHNGEKVQIEIMNTVRRSKGIIRIDAEYGEEIAESDELSLLEN